MVRMQPNPRCPFEDNTNTVDGQTAAPVGMATTRTLAYFGLKAPAVSVMHAVKQTSLRSPFVRCRVSFSPRSRRRV